MSLTQVLHFCFIRQALATSGVDFSLPFSFSSQSTIKLKLNEISSVLVIIKDLFFNMANVLNIIIYYGNYYPIITANNYCLPAWQEFIHSCHSLGYRSNANNVRYQATWAWRYILNNTCVLYAHTWCMLYTVSLLLLHCMAPMC